VMLLFSRVTHSAAVAAGGFRPGLLGDDRVDSLVVTLVW
jgi:hypothetical protein